MIIKYLYMLCYDNLISKLKSDEIEFEEKIFVLKCSEEENIH